MTDARFNAIYELAQIKELEDAKKEYERLNKETNMFSSFDDYLQEVQKLNSKISKDKTPRTYKAIEDCYIYKDEIEKDGLIFEFHLIRFPFYSSAQLDENYKSIPLEEKILFECGLSIKMDEYTISNLFSNVSENRELIEKKYDALLDKIKNSKVDEILEEIEKMLKK